MNELPKFTPEDDIFRDEEVLRDTHKPERLLERDTELAEYQNALKPVIKGSRPKNIFLVGQTGTGKTAATWTIRDRLQADAAEYDHVNPEFVYLNCNNLSTSYRVAIKLANKFLPPDDQLSTIGGYPGDYVYDRLYEELRTRDATHVMIILDEVDQIGKRYDEPDDEILYELPRANDHAIPREETYVGVIGISNDFTFRDNLDARVKDSLMEEEIHFPPYDADELRTILRHRVEKAFVGEFINKDENPDHELGEDGVVNQEVIALCAAMAGDESGSARQALRFLYKAGDLARKADAPYVTREHVYEAEPIVKESKARRELERLPNQSHLTLYAVLMLHARGDLPVRSQVIYEEYEAAAERIDANVKTKRTILDRLSQLQLKGFLETDRQNKGNQGGRYDLYHFGDIDPDVVHEVLKEAPRTGELFDGQQEIGAYY